jgi:nicotinamidase-related amidase
VGYGRGGGVMNAVPQLGSPAGDYVGAFAPRIEIDPRATCLVVVDLQHAFASRTAGLGRLLAAEGRADAAEYRFSRIERLVVPNTARLLRACRESALGAVFLVTGSAVADYSDLPPHLRELCRATNIRVGEREHELLPELAPRPGEPVLNKLSLSAFASTPVQTVLRSRGVTTLVFAGITTNMCVEHNVRDAADRGFACVVAEDACATDSRQMHEASLRNIGRLYGRVTTTDAVVSELAWEAARA